VVFTSEDHAIAEAIIPVVNSRPGASVFALAAHLMAEAMIHCPKWECGGVFEGRHIPMLLNSNASVRTVRQDGNGGFMHNKVIVVDDVT
jgi:hypothetical protein